MLIKAEGIVIKTINYGEGSKIIILYTRNKGKVAVMAKNARRTKSRFHAITQIFSYGDYIYFMGKEMGSLNQGDLQSVFTDIYHDIEKTAYAAYIAELVDKMTEQNDEPNPFLFQQLLSSLEYINEGKDLEVIARIFEMKILLISGYRPHLHACSICGREEELTHFSVKYGGIICNRHKEQGTINLQQGSIKLLRLFETMDIKRLGNINVKDSTKSELSKTLRLFYDEYIGIPLKSRNFLDQLNKYS